MQYAALITNGDSATIKVYKSDVTMKVGEVREMIRQGLTDDEQITMVQLLAADPVRLDVDSNLRRRAINFINAVCEIRELNVDKLLAPTRGRLPYSDTRHMICHILHSKTSLSLTHIGSLLNRSHCTVLSSIQQAENLLSTNYDFRKMYRECEPLF